jgi:uncharacterized coiled-coil DUF342 family protein
MISNEFNTAIYAAIAGVVVGGIVKLANKLMESDKTELATHIILRKELREELDSVKMELRHIQTELTEWKQKYFDQVQLTNELKVELLTISEDLAEYKKRTDSFSAMEVPSNLPLDN